MSNPPKKWNPYQAEANSQRAMLVNRNAVHLGEKLEIKGDAERLKELEETYEALLQKKLAQTEQQSKKLLQEAAQKAAQVREELIALAEKDAQARLAEIDAVIEAARQEGFDNGYQTGYQDARNQAEEDTITLLESARTLAEGAHQARKYVLSHFQQDALSLVRYICQRVLQQELVSQPEQWINLIDHAVESLYLSGKIKVVVNTDVLNHLRQFSAKTEEALTRLSRYELIGDARLSPEQLFVISSEGSYSIGPDAQVDTLLKPLEGNLSLPAVNDSAIQAVSSAPLSAETVIDNQSVTHHESSVSFDELQFETIDFDDDDDEITSTPHYPSFMDTLPNLEEWVDDSLPPSELQPPEHPED